MNEGVTLDRFAVAAGIAPERVLELCQRFADYLPAMGSGRARRWAPERVGILRTIDELDGAGYSPDQIRAHLAASATAAELAVPEAAGHAASGTAGASAYVPESEPAYPLSLEDALRTIGTGLDRLKVVRFAQISIDGHGIMVDATSPPIHMLHVWSSLVLETSSQRQARRSGSQPAPDADLLALTHWSVVLRLVGALMEADRVYTGVLEAQIARTESPTAFDVRLHTDRGTRDLHEDLQQLLLRRRAQYARRTREGQGQALDPRQPRRRWWPRA